MAYLVQQKVSDNILVGDIQWGGNHWTSTNTAGDTTVISYAFGGPGQDLTTRIRPRYEGSTNITGTWLDYERLALQAAQRAWESVANINFLETTDTGLSTNMVEYRFTASSPADLGAHNTPDDTMLNEWGVYNGNSAGFDRIGLQAGGRGFTTMLHEIGHGLGLAHPFDGGGGSGLFPGVTVGDPFSFGENNLNQRIYTTMAYNSGWKKGPLGAPTSEFWGREMGPMAFDIAAIQDLYGPNTTTGAGASTYLLPDANVSGTGWTCIWDTSGVDSITYLGTRNTIISLVAATLDNTPTGGGVVSYASGVMGGYTIANGVLIENANGGSGNDTITGNAISNTLNGGGGNDYIDGAGGGDIVSGEGGNDVIFGDIGIDDLFGGSGNDYMDGGAEGDRLNGSVPLAAMISLATTATISCMAAWVPTRPMAATATTTSTTRAAIWRIRRTAARAWISCTAVTLAARCMAGPTTTT
jgi:serralysin